MKKLFPLLILIVLVWSCQSKTPEVSENKQGVDQFKLTELWSTDTVFKTPESVYFDAARNVLYVANMNLDVEGNTGFISKLNTDGSIIELEWISGLIQPRGMGVFKNKLFVTDHTRLVIIDIEKGEILKTVPVEGATFLNDLTIAVDGTVYFSDSRGSKLQMYKDDEIINWFPEYPKPNGLSDQGEDLLICASEVGEVRLMNKETLEYKVLATGISGDGIDPTGIKDYYIVSEWSGRIHIIGQDTVQTILDTSEEKINSADFAYDAKTRTVYVPTFFKNHIVAYKLE